MTKKAHHFIRREVTDYLRTNQEKYKDIITLDEDDKVPRRMQKASKSVKNNFIFSQYFIILNFVYTKLSVIP